MDDIVMATNFESPTYPHKWRPLFSSSMDITRDGRVDHPASFLPNLVENNRGSVTGVLSQLMLADGPAVSANGEPKRSLFETHLTTLMAPTTLVPRIPPILEDTLTNVSSLISLVPTNATNVTAEVNSDDINHKLMIYYKTLVPTWIVCCMASLILNAVIVISSRWVPRPMTPTVTLSLSLAAADAYTSLVLCSSLVYDSLLVKMFKFDFGSFETCISLVIEVCRFGGVVVTALHLLALSVNHLFGASYPLRYPRNVRQNLLAGIIAALWIVPITFFAIYFSSVPGEGFQSQHCLQLQFFWALKFRSVVAVLIFIPLVVMTCIYAKIYATIRESRRIQLTVHRCETTQQARQRNNKAMVTTLLILGTYSVGWLPAACQLVAVCNGCPFDVKEVRKEELVIGTSITNSLLILKSIVDPIVYAVRIPEIRNAVQTLWHKWFLCDVEDWSRTRGDVRMRSISASRARAMGIHNTRFRSWHGSPQARLNNSINNNHLNNIGAHEARGTTSQLNGFGNHASRPTTLQRTRGSTRNYMVAESLLKRLRRSKSYQRNRLSTKRRMNHNGVDVTPELTETLSFKHRLPGTSTTTLTQAGTSPRFFPRNANNTSFRNTEALISAPEGTDERIAETFV